MRITTSQLRRIIKEEAQRVLGTNRRTPSRRRRMFEGPDDPDEFAAPDDDVEGRYMDMLEQTYGPEGKLAAINFAILKDLEGKIDNEGYGSADSKTLKKQWFEKTFKETLKKCFGPRSSPSDKDFDYIETLARTINNAAFGDAAVMAEDWANKALRKDPMPVVDFFGDLERQKVLPQSKAPGITWSTPL